MNILMYLWNLYDMQKYVKDSFLVYYGYKSPYKVCHESLVNQFAKNIVYNSLNYKYR